MWSPGSGQSSEAWRSSVSWCQEGRWGSSPPSYSDPGAEWPPVQRRVDIIIVRGNSVHDWWLHELCHILAGSMSELCFADRSSLLMLLM